MSDTRLYAVAGQPVIHSLSPQIFNTLFRSLKIAAVYFRLAASGGEEIVQTAEAMDLAGLNVTAPFKSEILKFLDDASEEAKTIGAVNTVVSINGMLKGHNTDHIGVVNTLKHNNIPLTHKSIAVLGAGGAARAAAYGVLKEGTGKVTLLNRTEARAAEAAHQLGCDYAPFHTRARILKHSDILISCVSTGERFIEPDLLHERLTVFDANYKNSRLLQDAAEKGCRTINGKQWLIHQALPAFHLFTGQNPAKDTEPEMTKEMEKTEPPKSNMALIGFMGTGKTAVGKALAKITGFKFVDIDAVIERSAGRTIPEIFEDKGEEAFRILEKQAIHNHIPGSKSCVFSLGGGAVCAEENRSLLRKHCRCVWLWSTVQTALGHINTSTRPLLEGGHPEQKALALLAARIPLYARTSDMAISTETGNPEEAAKRIKDEMDQAF